MEHRTPSQAVRDIAAILEQITRDKDTAGQITMGHAIDLFLDARQIARDALAVFRLTAERESLIADFRLAMARLELAVNDLIRAQPDTSPEVDQRLVDAATEPLNWIAERLPELERREGRGQPPIH